MLFIAHQLGMKGGVTAVAPTGPPDHEGFRQNLGRMMRLLPWVLIFPLW